MLNFYKKSSIAVVPSKWQEPFGRTSMESAAYGCATITSKNGGLPETFKNPIFMDQVNENELFKKIKKLIDFPKLRKKIQLQNFKSVMHKLEYKIKKLDDWKKRRILLKILIL